MSNPFHGRAIVSLTFDDNDKCQITTTDPILRDHGVRGTFYNLVSRVDQDGYLSLEDVRALVRNGHRAGSHANPSPGTPRRRRLGWFHRGLGGFTRMQGGLGQLKHGATGG